MAGPATIAASTAILKTKYADGCPKQMMDKFPTWAMLAKKEDFNGLNKQVAVQTENPQGSSAIFNTAQGALQQGAYFAFLLTRVEHFGIVRIKGQAMRAAEGDSGALVDLWTNETNGAAQTELKMKEIYLYGTGNGVLAQIAAASNITTATFSLANPTDVVKLDLGMSMDFVGDTTYSPVVRPVTQQPRIIAINRSTVTPSVTVQAALNTLVPTVTTTDYIVRAGDWSSGGNPGVIVGMAGYVVGGTSPAPLFGLTRSVDPVRLSGQTIDASQYTSMEEAIIEAEGQVNVQGKYPDTIWANPRDIANLKKSLGGKATYPRTQMNSADGTFSFRGISFEGTNQEIKIMSSPFCPRNTFFMVDWSSFASASLGKAPQLLDYDNNGVKNLVVPTDDAVEARWGSYDQVQCDNPASNIIGINWGL